MENLWSKMLLGLVTMGMLISCTKDNADPKDPFASADFSWTPLNPSLFDTMTFVNHSSRLHNINWYSEDDLFWVDPENPRALMHKRGRVSIILEGEDSYHNPISTTKTMYVTTGASFNGTYTFKHERRENSGTILLPDTMLTVTMLNDSTLRIGSWEMQNHSGINSFSKGTVLFKSNPVSAYRNDELEYRIAEQKFDLTLRYDSAWVKRMESFEQR